ncbi:hypothetical protein N2152v2_008227 [Parachlorella kessleri]
MSICTLIKRQLDLEELWAAFQPSCKQLGTRKPEDWWLFLSSLAAFLCPKLSSGEIHQGVQRSMHKHPDKLPVWKPRDTVQFRDMVAKLRRQGIEIVESPGEADLTQTISFLRRRLQAGAAASRTEHNLYFLRIQVVPGSKETWVEVMPFDICGRTDRILAVLTGDGTTDLIALQCFAHLEGDEIGGAAGSESLRNAFSPAIDAIGHDLDPLLLAMFGLANRTVELVLLAMDYTTIDLAKLGARTLEKPEKWRLFLRSLVAFLCPKLSGGEVVFETLRVLQGTQGVPEEEVVRKAEMLTLNHLQSSLDRLTLLADIRVAFHQLAAALYLYEGPHQLRKQYQLSAISTLEDMPGTMDAGLQRNAVASLVACCAVLAPVGCCPAEDFVVGQGGFHLGWEGGPGVARAGALSILDLQGLEILMGGLADSLAASSVPSWGTVSSIKPLSTANENI